MLLKYIPTKMTKKLDNKMTNNNFFVDFQNEIMTKLIKDIHKRFFVSEKKTQPMKSSAAVESVITTTQNI